MDSEKHKQANKKWRENNKNYMRDYYLKNKDRLNLKSREYSKKNPVKYQKEYYIKNKVSINKRNTCSHFKLKCNVLYYYSKNEVPYCFWCGETDIDCLSIDHINGNGTKHRKFLSEKNGYTTFSGYIFYRWLRKEGYPKGFQVLCMNCQFKKRMMNKELRR